MRSRPGVRAIPAAILAAGIAVASAAAAGAATSVAPPIAWTQYQGDALHTGVAVAAPSPPYGVTWTTATGIGDETHFAGIPAPVVAGGDAVVVDREDVTAVSISTGAVSWTIRRKLGPSVPAAVVSRGDGRSTILYTEGGGDRSSSASVTPTPSASGSGGTSSPTAHSTLVAVDATTQDELWRRELPDVSISGPTVDGSVVLVGTDDGSVTAVALDTGRQLWTPVDLGDDVNTPIVAAAGIAYVAVNSDARQGAALVALRETDGSDVWRYTPGATGLSVGTPSLSDGTVFVTLSDASVRAVDASSGVLRWAAKLNTVAGGGAPAVSSDALVVVDIRGQVYRLDPSNGTRSWDFAMNVPVYGPAAIAGGAVVVGDADGEVSALDLQTGDRIWEQRLGDGLVLALAVTPDAVVVARTGPFPGLIALANDPSGVLIREESPTILKPLLLLLAWAAAAVPLVLLLASAGRFLNARLAPVELASAAGDDDEQIEDDLS